MHDCLFCANLVTICGRLIKITDCKSFNKQAEQWKTTIDSLCLNREEGHADAGKIIRFICGKSIVVSTVPLACCKTFAICCIKVSAPFPALHSYDLHSLSKDSLSKDSHVIVVAKYFAKICFCSGTGNGCLQVSPSPSSGLYWLVSPRVWMRMTWTCPWCAT